jgi:serine protease
VDGVLSTIGDDSSGSIEMGYAFSLGTSMAAPHVAGVVALMKALYPGLTPDTFDALLEAEALTRDLGDAGRDDRFGWGLIDAHKAVLIAQEGGENGGIPAILSVSPSTLRLSGSPSSAPVTVANSGNPDASLTVSAYGADESWLSVVSADTDADGLGTYTVTVDSEGLADGIHSGTLTFTSNVNQALVTVILLVGSATDTSDGGHHYILLLNADTYETVDQFESAGKDGVYTYQFTQLSYGDTYTIYAGTNPDGDRYICEEGEACGAYLSLDQPVPLTVGEDMENIDFFTDINFNLSTTGQSLSLQPVFLR